MIRHGILESSRSKVVGATYPTDGLLYRWAFNALDSSCIDSQGNLNLVAAGTGLSYPAGKVGGCAYTNTNGYYTATMSYAFSSISISVWFKSPAYTSAEAICRKGNDFMFQTELAGGKLFFQGLGTASWQDIYTTTNVADNAWHHGVVTWGGGTQKLYLDNDAEVVTATSAGGPANAATDFIVGRISNNTQKWAGWLDQMYIYNKVLSVAEVAQLWNGGAGI